MVAKLRELDKLIASSEKLDKKKVDFEGAPDSLTIANTGKVTFEKTEDFFGKPAMVKQSGLLLETNALSQLLSRVSVPFFGKGNGTTMDRADWETMLDKYPKYFAAIINDLIPQIESKGLLVRTDGKSIRAILTNKYGIVDNTEVLTALRAILAELGADLPDLSLARSSVTRDRLDARIIFIEPKIKNPEMLPQGDTRRGDPRANRPYGIGVYVGNEETGRGGLNVYDLIQRGGCSNSIIIKRESSINLRHVGSPQALIGQVKMAMINSLPLAAESLEKVYAAVNKELPNLTDIISGLTKQYGWADETVSQVLIGTEGQQTVMGLVNGVSYAASLLKDSTDQVEMEMQAGSILTAPDSLFARAAQQSINARR